MHTRCPPTAHWLAGLALAAAVAGLSGCAPSGGVPLNFTGGHDIGANDYGRPVVLIAAALGVKPDEFRRAFSGVTPARGGAPSGDLARRNKEALMSVLGPLGVTNDRLDEVSNHYRYQPQKGELWKTSPAKGYAIIEDGAVRSIVITRPGSGYSSPPQVTIRGREDVDLKVTLHLDTDFKRNGSIASIELLTEN